MPTKEILAALHALDERPWGDLRGRPVDSRWLSRHLAKYGVKAKDVRVADAVVRGYDSADLHDPWSRYVAAGDNPLWESGNVEESTKTGDVGVPAIGSATSATTATQTLNLGHLPGRCQTCEYHVETQGHADDCTEASQ
jgi:Protein of unknown function (DUF3631)